MIKKTSFTEILYALEKGEPVYIKDDNNEWVEFPPEFDVPADWAELAYFFRHNIFGLERAK